jgi:uncharacterized membrane protein
MEEMGEQAMKVWSRRVLPGLLAASALCTAAVVLRVHHTGLGYYRFLVWNLFLAWIPLLVALGAHAGPLRGRAGVTALTPVWLLFFPNAPYIVSDFVHLHHGAAVPLWFDAMMLAGFATTGMLLGFASLYLMQIAWSRVAGRLVSWVGVGVTLFLASVGVYLGRVFRFNSWDVVVRPREIGRVLIAGLVNPAGHRFTVAALVLLTAALMLGYALLYGLTGLRTSAPRERLWRDS